MGPVYVMGLGIDLPLVVSAGVVATEYTIVPNSNEIYTNTGNEKGKVTSQDMQRMANHIRNGTYADPEPLSWPVMGGKTFSILASPERDRAASNLEKTFSIGWTYYPKCSE